MATLIVIAIIIYLISKSSYNDYGSSNSSHTDSQNNNTPANSINNQNDINTVNESPSINTQDEYHFFTKIAGVTYYNRQEYIKSCYKGQQLDLIRDKFNEYDKNAIAVYAGDNQIGFIAKYLAEKLALQMDTGTMFSCYVEDVTGKDAKFRGVNVKIVKHESSYKSTSDTYNTTSKDYNYNLEENFFGKTLDDQNDDDNNNTYYTSDYDDDREEEWSYDDLCDYYGCEEDDWPE